MHILGKIFGLEGNYIIAEGEFREGEGEEEEAEETLEVCYTKFLSFFTPTYNL